VAYNIIILINQIYQRPKKQIMDVVVWRNLGHLSVKDLNHCQLGLFHRRYQLLLGCPDCKSKNIVKTEDSYLCCDYKQDYQIRKFASATISFAMLSKAISPLFEALSYKTYLPFPILSDMNPSWDIR